MNYHTRITMKFITLPILVVLILLFCSKGVSVTETDTGEFKSWVVDRNRAPISDARVVVRERDSVIDSTRTAQDGFFHFDSLRVGAYYVDVCANDSLGALAKVDISDQSTSLTIDTVIALQFGTIRGSIDTSLIKNDQTQVYLVELDRTAPVDGFGVFSFGKVPPWNYTIQLIQDTVMVPSILDTIVVKVTEKDTATVYNIGSGFGDLSIESDIYE